MAIILGLVYAYTYHTIQPPINFRDSKLSDSKKYEKSYNYFKRI